jgi:polysaccharide deacetylase family protein (PEP-CTERM system associated)
MLNALTVDVEDYFQVSAFEHRVRRQDWDSFPSRVVASTQRVLRLLDRHQVRGTFFVLGWVAERFPGLVREIVRAGHEAGCHSFWHRLVYELTPDEFAEDLRLARDAIADAAGGAAVTSYRAPSFSITRRTPWALEILRAEGFRCDSSIFPIHHDRYGIPDANPHPHLVTTPAGELWEFPPAVYRACGVNIPVSGGGYFRLYPLALSRICLQRINRRGHPFAFYIHPWELDPEQPRMPGSPMAQWRHRVNLRSTQRKLDALLGRFRFGRIGEVLSQLQTHLHSAALPTPAAAVAP